MRFLVCLLPFLAEVGVVRVNLCLFGRREELSFGFFLCVMKHNTPSSARVLEQPHKSYKNLASSGFFSLTGRSSGFLEIILISIPTFFQLFFKILHSS